MEHPFTNKLIHESSPYLLQHAHNPVEWYPWGDEALAKAKAENKLLLISIGYSSCHWCHVMEHESFEDTAVAAVMNEHFVCIKVDREERPDIDDVYMMACQLASGGGCGWPLNSFAMPDGRPVWAGTYFPKSRWLEILAYFKQTYADEPEKMEAYASQLVQGVRDHGLDSALHHDVAPITTDDVHLLAKQFMDRMDPIMGGRRGAPKFPMPNNWDFLMHYAYRYKNQRAAELVKTTLDKMMMGGIYDQLEGGFARYAVDSVWLVPHFEKMLYDNGQLVSTYAKAYAWTGDSAYLDLVTQTADFAMKYWSDDAGGFYSSYDADSEKEEGKYYVWTTTELEELISNEKDRMVFYDFNDIKPQGNWEHNKNILQRHKRISEVAKTHAIESSEVERILREIYADLIKARSKRVMPGLDDKVLSSWNGLMLNGLIDAYHATGEVKYRERALANANFLLKHMIHEKDGYRMDRNYKNGKSTINAFLDDYAITISAFLNLYQSTFDITWLDHAKGLTEHVMQHFSGEENALFYYTSDIDPPLVARRIDFSDNVIPAANSIMARNLFTLGTILYHQPYLDRSNQMLMTVWKRMQQDAQPAFYSNWCQLILDVADPPYEVAIVGNESVEKLAMMRKTYQPHAIYLGGDTEGTLPLLENKAADNQTLIYVCRNKICKLPTADAPKALSLLAE
jgi:uncharacterized protein YyaL (SSP411 family)